MIKIINGSLLECSGDQFIIHQVNCYSTGSAGLAAAIFSRFPWADVYSSCPRCGDDSSLLGSVTVHKNPERNQPSVINVFGQLYPGKPSSGRDSAEARLQAFGSALDQIASLADLRSVGFPCGIGCGLAGGDWELYIRVLEAFAGRVARRGVSVTLYCINKRPHSHSTFPA
jgi:O-acetyl-ADP-ribose deacetylase (regulator of RNase III)